MNIREFILLDISMKKLKNDTVIPKNNNKEMNNNIKDNKKEDMNLIYINVFK